MSSEAVSLARSLSGLRELGQQLRVDSIRASDVTKSGHPTSSMSAADLMAVLFGGYLRYDFDQPENPLNDHLIFSKGHALPLLYSLYAATGAISKRSCSASAPSAADCRGIRRRCSPGLTSQPVRSALGFPSASVSRSPASSWNGRPIASGCCVATARWRRARSGRRSSTRHHYGLDNLVVIVDVNRLGQRGETMNGWQIDRYLERARAFGCRAIATDGHDVAAIDSAFADAVAGDGRPTVIVAKTIKGKGVVALEDREGWHGKALADPEAPAEPLPEAPAEAAAEAPQPEEVQSE